MPGWRGVAMARENGMLVDSLKTEILTGMECCARVTVAVNAKSRTKNVVLLLIGIIPDFREHYGIR